MSHPVLARFPSPPGPAAPSITVMQVFLDRLDSDIVDFEPAAEQLAAIDALDTGGAGGPEPDSITLEAFGPRGVRPLGSTTAV